MNDNGNIPIESLVKPRSINNVVVAERATFERVMCKGEWLSMRQKTSNKYSVGDNAD